MYNKSKSSRKGSTHRVGRIETKPKKGRRLVNIASSLTDVSNVCETRKKLRGRGRSMNVKSFPGKDFDFLCRVSLSFFSYDSRFYEMKSI